LTWLRRIAELYRLNRQRLQQETGTPEFSEADTALWEHVAAMAGLRDAELVDDTLRQPCRKALESLREHWTGLTLFVDDPRIPLDNNYGERLIRKPAIGRKNYYGSTAARAGRLAMMLFSILATLVLWKINPRKWLQGYFEACAASGGQVPENPASYLSWNLPEERLADLQSAHSSTPLPDTS